MEADFWHNMWNTNRIGFHLHHANELLIQNFPKLKLEQGSRIFLPLCGKTLDIKWLLENGFRVVGVELSELAIQDLFSSLNIEPKIEYKESFIHYSALNIDIYVGDIFNLTQEALGIVDAIYDRAAIVALPEDLRVKYTKQLLFLTNHKKQLLITLDYDQSLKKGPPFCVSPDDIMKYYNDEYNHIELLKIQNDNGFGDFVVKERVWLLH